MIRQITEAGILAALGVWSIWDGIRISTTSRAGSSFDALGPDRYIIGIGIILLVLSAFRLHAARAEAAVGEVAVPAPQSGPESRRFAQLAIAFAGYSLLVSVGGYVLTTALFFLAVYWIMGLRGVSALSIATVASTAAFALIFITLAGLPLPRGQLGLPY